jgi:mono/diheme cytochrome c family protein
MAARVHVTWKTVMLIVVPVLLAFGLLQLVPYRVTDPATAQEPTWDRPQTRQLAQAACFDCHSNETHAYWFEKVAPLSWWITSHVKGGRGALNFSECKQSGRSGEDDAAETVRNGSMPPGYYTWLGLHSNAKLTAAQKQKLAEGLRATLSGWNCGEGG